MHTTRHIALILLLLALGVSASAQKVGVVLSGGGATAMAHVGFLKALERSGIPIDYISGTSMGAIIGGMYASGYSIAEIDSIVRSDEYANMALGTLDDDLKFYFKEPQQDASMATLKYAKGSFISTTIPTNLIDPVLLDYNFMASFSQPSAAAKYDFDSLFVPFRCIAADIESKEEIVFRKGHLNVALRASTTYPFYLKPIRVDGHLLFDGGLYNNFPSNVMYTDFLPDIIIGCNVSENEDPPTADDLLSQLKNMVVYKTNFESVCEHMMVVEPVTSVGTFDFDRIGEAIDAGYESTMNSMDSLQALINRRVAPEEVAAGRKAFRSKFKPLVIDDISISGLDKSQRNYVRKIFGTKRDTIGLQRLKPVYFRVFADDKISSIYPVAMFNEKTGYFGLNLDVKKEKDIFMSFGGNFSSRPINTGFFGVRYNIFGKTSSTLSANSYFGKFYGSVNVSLKLDISGRVPFSIQPGFTFNRWDYFKSFATFFEEVRPSFIVSDERFGGLKLTFASGNHSKVVMDANYAIIADDYYQTESFLAADTADQTVFEGLFANLRFERSTLNRKQYANTGSLMTVEAGFVTGDEESRPGSTSAIRDTTFTAHQWFRLRAKYRSFPLKMGPLSVGVHAEGMMSTQGLFQNYTASVIAAPGFYPIPESRTFWLDEYRSYNFWAAGSALILSVNHNLDFRGEAYVYSPYGRIIRNEATRPEFEFDFDPKFIGSAAAVYQTPIGPLSFSVNYYDKKREPWSFIFNFGYILFNESVRDR
jgi:NTE family protein